MTTLVWFRQDLRLQDNPALYYAAQKGLVVPVYIFDDTVPKIYLPGSASNFWLHYSLCSLNNSLDNKLLVYKGNPEAIIKNLIKLYNIKYLHYNKCHEPWQIERDNLIKQNLINAGICAIDFNDFLLWDHNTILKKDGTPYKVFTPFYRKGCLNANQPDYPLGKPDKINFYDYINTTKIEDLKLLDSVPWHKKLLNSWNIGETAAINRFEQFLQSGIINYKTERNFFSYDSTSRMSPYIHFGEISINYIWHSITSLESIYNNPSFDHFCSELGWREFSYYLLKHFPDISKNNFSNQLDNFNWLNDSKMLQAWQKGLTGFPVVDAGMRELWQTGYMHNRVRMITASFLIKNLLIHWKLGEQWFWDCLVDADLASNNASWQWVAGCGADAAPYFRIFNPIVQGKSFDPDAKYVKKFVPEVKNLPEKYIFSPWEASNDILNQADVKLGYNYPHPIIDFKLSRQRALDMFQNRKS